MGCSRKREALILWTLLTCEAMQASQVALVAKNPPANAGDLSDAGSDLSDPWFRKIPWRTKWQPTPGSLPGESHGQRSLAGYSPWGHKESDTTKVT